MPSLENKLATQAVDELRAAGFIVSSEVALPFDPRSRADLVAWVADPEGRLTSAMVVEFKQAKGSPKAALNQLAAYANAFGTARAYIFDGTWHRADEAYAHLTESPIPHPSDFERNGTDDETHSAFRSAMETLAANLRAQGQQDDLNELLGHIAAAVGKDGTSGVPFLDDILRAVPGDKALDELRGAIERIAVARKSPLAPTPHTLSDAMAALASLHDGDLVEDPFAGFGNCLWSAHALARASGVQLRLRGSEINSERLDIARALARLGGIHVELEAADFFASEKLLAPIVLADPPIGGRESSPRRLSFGEETTDRDVAILDRMVSRLPEGGRLVQVVSPRLLFGDGAPRRMRDHLARTVRMVSIIELPPKALGWTAIRCALVVIEKGLPAPTLVARLGDDWAQQLTPGGAFLAEYLTHLGAVS